MDWNNSWGHASFVNLSPSYDVQALTMCVQLSYCNKPRVWLNLISKGKIFLEHCYKTKWVNDNEISLNQYKLPTNNFNTIK